MQPHLKIDTIEKYVLLPGDPGRVDTIKKYLDQPKEIGFNRYRIAGGQYQGLALAVMSTGMGCPSAAIAVEELANLGAETLIRIGTCGGLLKEMRPGDLVIPDAAFCGDGTTREYNPTIEMVKANQEVTEALIQSAEKLGVRYFVGTNRTHDAFYEPIGNFTRLAGKGLVSSEMECSAVYLVSELRGLKAGAVLVINTPEPPEEVAKNPDMIYQLVDQEKVRQGVENAIKVSLEAIVWLENSRLGPQKK